MLSLLRPMTDHAPPPLVLMLVGMGVDGAAGGLGLSTNDSAMVFEALGMGDTALAGYLCLHNMVAWIVSKCVQVCACMAMHGCTTRMRAATARASIDGFRGAVWRMRTYVAPSSA